MKKYFCSKLTLIIFAFIALTLNVFSQENQCSSCEGKGYQTCIRCSGQGSYPCDQCDGKGGRWEICNCDNGIVHMPDGTTQTCNYCKGEGKKWHSCYNPNCSDGIAFCHFCKGQGTITCPVCKGK
jgi:hypothetical protein